MRIPKCGINKAVFLTSFGWAGVAATEQGISRVVLPKKEKEAAEQELRGSETGAQRPESNTSGETTVLGRAVKLLIRYFSGERVSFDLPLDMRYYTAFQQAVWKSAAQIPYGETRSYAWIAKGIRNPKAARAVGQALGANPIPIIIPCHRVISSGDTLGGFSAGVGLKKHLLELEMKANDRR